MPVRCGHRCWIAFGLAAILLAESPQWVAAQGDPAWTPDRSTTVPSTLNAPVQVRPVTPAASASYSAGPLWWLARNPQPAPGDPPYVLLDSEGRVHRFIEPSPSLNPEPFLGQQVRLRHDTGRTLLASQLDYGVQLPVAPEERSHVSPPVRPAAFQSSDPHTPIVLEEVAPGAPAPNQPLQIQPPPIASPPLASPSGDFRAPAQHVCGPSCGPECGDTCQPYSYSSSPDYLAPNFGALLDPSWIGDLLSPVGSGHGGLGHGIGYGGWTQLGYHTEQTPLSVTRGDLAAFNDVPSGLRLQQQWFWIGKQANRHAGPDWGFQFDILYGTDAQKTQAFGNPGAGAPGFGTWDASLDHGIYGWAVPQLYGELAADGWSVIFGHFFTPVGYEVVAAPDNFFYSHSLTMNNSEPFTHTGALATFQPYGNRAGIEFYAGYGMGWDTGFDQAMDGSNFIGGVSVRPASSVTLAYIATVGNFGARSGGGSGYTHSIVADVAVTPRLTYVLQSDYVDYDDQTGTGVGDDQFGVNQYLLYALNKRWGAGARIEWWKSDGRSFYEMTYGLNYRMLDSLVFRPEIRHDWAPGGLPGGSADETTFGVDAVLTY